MRTLKLLPTAYFVCLFNISFFIFGETYLHVIKNYKNKSLLAVVFFNLLRNDELVELVDK